MKSSKRKFLTMKKDRENIVEKPAVEGPIDQSAEAIAQKQIEPAGQSDSKELKQSFNSSTQIAEAEPAGEYEAEIDTESINRHSFNWLDLVFVVFCFIVSQGLGGFIAMSVGVELPNELMRSSFETEVVEAVGAIQARFVAISYMISMAICLILLGVYSRIRGWRDLLSLRSLGWASPFRLLCGYIFMWLISLSLEPLTAMLPGDQSSMGNGGWLLLSAVLLAPVFEEIVFRGYIAGGLRRTYGGVVAWIVSALIFGVVHVTPSVAVTAFFSGLVLSFYYLRYRSLMLVILLHAMNNATACFLLSIGMGETSLYDILSDSRLYWGIYGVATLICVSVFLRMWRQLSRLKSDNSEGK